MSINKKIVFEIFALVFLVMSAVPVCGQSDFGSPDVHQKGFSFYAVYDRLADTESLEGQIWCAAMSGDGNRLIFSTTTDTFLYTVNADGSDLTSIPLSADLIGIGGVTIDYDGSRAFFMARDAGWIHLIYKVEGGVATQILDTYDHSEIGRCTGIETTAGGDYVYFTEDRGSDLWRIRHGGGTPEKVIEDTEVPREEGSQSHGRKVKDFAISADGSTIAFVLYYYVDPTDGDRFKEELFVLDGDGYRQLTNDDKNIYKSYFDISGDGTTIVFSASSPQNKWYSIRSDGSAKIALEAVGSGGNLALNYDGTRMFYYDAGANGGRLVNTDGSGSIDLFPSWSAGAIMIAASFDPCISDDGRRVSFRYISGGGPLYVGYLNDPEAVPDSPTIHNIVFDPPAMPRGDPDARVIVTSEISDPQGLADIERTRIDELVDGRLESSSNVPVYFYLGYYGGTRDEGDWPDETAGDGIFSNAGKPGGKIDELDQMTVRMGAMDASKTVVIADKVLSIGGVIPTPTPTLTPTPSTTPTETPTPILPPVVTPRPAPEEGPDLTISSTDYWFEDDGRVLVLFVEIANQGNVVAIETLVYAGDIEHDWLHEYGSVQALDPDETTPIEIWLDISEELRGTIRTFRVEVDPEDAVREIDEGNNEAMTPRIPLPLLEEAPIEEPPEDELPLLEVVVTLGAISGIIFTIRRIFEIRRRNEWQGKAKEEEPLETCQPCTRYCRKIELELEPALWNITHLSFGASDPVSGKQSKERQVRGELVDGLNKSVMAHRRREKPEKLQEQVAHLAHALLQQIMEWLRGESAPRDVFVTGHLEGGKVTCQFILYHCKRRGTVNVWEEDAKWNATIKDEHDEFVGTLRGMEPTELGIPEQVAPDLARLLMQFIEKV